jgi:methionyl aminopeptidase
MMIQSDHDLEMLRKACDIAGSTLRHMSEAIRVGMSTAELDDIGAQFMQARGARSAPQVTYNFPGATCISLANEAAHGIPSADRIIKAGEIVNIDVSVEYEGYFGDNGATYLVPPHRPSLLRLCTATKEALYEGIKVCRAGQKLNEIGKAIEKVARKYGFTIIENLASHGVGRALHEEPKSIPSFFDPQEKRILEKGLVITIEPFLSDGARIAEEMEDGWTLAVKKRYRTAQYEHTLVIMDNDALVLTGSNGF